MDSLLSVQEHLYERISKNRSNYKKTPKDRKTKQHIESRLEALEEAWKTFTITHKDLLKGNFGDSFKKCSYVTKDTFDSVEELYIDYKSELKDSLDKFGKHDYGVIKSSGSSVCEKGTSQIKLPKIVIPIFSGKYTEWPTFRDLFVSLIHNNETIDSVQKLHYLKGYLTGEAEQLIRNIPISTANYARCWELLHSRFNNKKYLSHCFINRLLSQKNATFESANFLKDLIDNTSDCLNSLTNLGIDVGNWDILIIHLIALKLDPESRKQWELNVTNSIASDELPTFAQFKDFLTNRYRALEFLDSRSTSNRSNNSQVNSNKPKTFHVTQVQCQFCNEAHKLAQCKKFAKEDVNNRRCFVEQNRICFNCLGRNHSAKFCMSILTCRICRSKHHTLLHFSPDGDQTGSGPSDQLCTPGEMIGTNSADIAVHVMAENSVPEDQSEENQPVASYFSSSKTLSYKQVILATALVQADSNKGDIKVLRALLDQGSQASFITEAMTQYLGLKKTPVKGNISVLNGNKDVTCNAIVTINLCSRVTPNVKISVQAYVLRTITSYLPSKKIIAFDWPELKDLQLADPQFHTPNKIDLLLGAEVYSQVINEGVKRDVSGSLIAQSTSFGWILSGVVKAVDEVPPKIVTMHTILDDNMLLRKFWELETESCTTKIYLSEDEKRCEEIFAATTERDITGRYIVNLPFKEEDPICKYDNHEEQATKRFYQLEKRLMKNPELKIRYANIIKEYLELGHMEVVPKEQRFTSGVVYLPHHAVVREDKSTTKVRVVFDASSTGSNSTSLNKDLLIGPKLQADLRHIIMRWRRHRICLVADIVKMYRQIKVHEKHVDFQRLVWRANTDEELQHLRLITVTFGTAAAPYLAVKCLQQVAHDDGKMFPNAVNIVLNDFYMDDLMTGCQSVEEGIQIYKEITELLKGGGFALQKWTSNCKELLKIVCKENEEALNTDVEVKMDEVTKILGLTWNRERDVFIYSLELTTIKQPVTKRNVLSDIARLFDPLGWLAPVIITAKIFMQKLWLSGIEWDEELPPQLLKDWVNYRNNLKQVSTFKVPRWICMEDDDVVQELHGFCDASAEAYAAVVYLRVVKKDGEVQTSLITSKTKVAPIKQVSIPRLELCGAVLLTRLLIEVAEVMSCDKKHINAWTDSSVVLAWLNSQPNKWKVFVANRVSEILTSLEPYQWLHVSSKDNPADCASRGTKNIREELLWMNGPKWLKEKIINRKVKREHITNLEEKTVNFTVVEECSDDIWGKYSSLNKLLRVVAYCRRALKKKEMKTNHSYLLKKEINEALEIMIKKCQGIEFKEELLNLRNKKDINKRSKLTCLSPFIDKVGIIRVGGRIQCAQIEDDIKHPIVIPHNSFLARLLVADAHFKTLHGGPQLMINFLRAKYWIIGVKNLVKFHFRKCVTCIRYKVNHSNQMMGQLPQARVSLTRTFLNTGVDYAGPINIRVSKGRGTKSYKGYICLFICMSTKAIHLEAVSDMSSEGFLAAFRRFVARRGHCNNLYSDNGSNFVGASRDLKELFNLERSNFVSDISDWLATNGTQWHFIPPRAPNFGGLWEAGIKSTKYHLHRIIGNNTLTFEEMATLLAQIESCLNSRPISYVEDQGDPMPLTPGHFLIGEPLILPPDRCYEDVTISSLKRWQLCQRLLQNFWRRWTQEYLTSLMQRYKWSRVIPEPKLGDVVLVKEPCLPPARWLMGRIVQKHPGADNMTRVVTVRCKNSYFKRPVSKICVLPSGNN